MSFNDSLSDMLTRIRNAHKANKNVTFCLSSNLNNNVLNVLKNEGYIRDYEKIEIREGINKIKIELKIPVLTDVHNVEQCSIVSKHVDVLQIPAFLCRQTDLLVAAAKTNKVINVKKGQFLAPWDMTNVTKKISESGNDNILVTERGASFGYNTLVSDMRSIPIMAKNGYPIVFDGTHSVQQPGGLGEKSGGQREFVEYLSRAATAVGIAAIFLETHQDPDNAPSDGPNMVPLDKLESLISQIVEIDNLVKNK